VAIDHGVRPAADSDSFAPSGWARARPRRGRLAAGIAVGVVVVAIGLPVVAVAVRSVWVDGSIDAEAIGRILGEPRTWRLIAVTVGQAVVSAAITIVIGVPVAWALSRFRFPGRRPLRTLVVVPFVLPSVVVGAAFATVLGPSGPVDLRGTWFAVLAAHLCFNIAVVVRVVGAAVGGLDPGTEDAARTLGCSTLKAARRVVLPAIRPAVMSAAVVVFLFCLASFGVIVILGGGSVTTVEVEIWVRATRQFDLSGAAVLAVIQVVTVVAALALHAHFARRAPVVSGARRVPQRAPRGGLEWSAVAFASLVALAVAGVPLAALVERSLRVPGGHGLEHWTNLGSVTAGTGLSISPLHAVLTSIATATTAAVIAVVVAVPAASAVARRPGGRADRVLLLPLGVSATTIGLGLLLLVGRPPIDLRGSWWLVPLGQALVAMPLVVRVVAPALASIPRSVPEAASLLGASPRDRWWRVDLPLARPAIGAGAGLALVACLGEFGATAFLTRSDRVTVPVAIERLMSRPGSAGFGQAMALSCILVLLCAGVVALIDHLAADDGFHLGF